MGVVYGDAHLDEEREAFADIQPSGIAVPIDRQSVDVFHDQIGPPVVRGASVVEPGDVGMLESGQDLAFMAETAEDVIGVHAALDQLEGDPLLELSVGAFGMVYGAHAASSDLLQKAVRADGLRGGGCARGRLMGQKIGSGVEESRGVLVSR